jgi:DNA polymerase-1
MKPVRQVVFDLESDGLFKEATRLWILVTNCVVTGERFIFCDHPGVFPDGYTVRPLSDSFEYLGQSKAVIGHNIIGFDLPVMLKLHGFSLPKNVQVVDTMIMSQVLDYKRFGFGHGLAQWGDFFDKKKPEHEDWSTFSNEMVTRCVEDTEINVLVYEYLKDELLKNPHTERLKLGLRVEHQAAEFAARAHYYGFPFNNTAALDLKRRLKAVIAEYEQYLTPRLIMRVTSKDGFVVEKNFKKPRWKANGDYVAATASWFGIDESEGQEGRRPIWGDYCRVEFSVPEGPTPDAIKDYLFSIGWEPDDWNFKAGPQGLVATSPKISSSSLALLGYDGYVIDNLLTSRSRLAVLEGWLNGVTPEGRLHGDMFLIGTPTARSVHKIIANIPKADTEVFVSDGERWVKDKSIKADLTDPEPWLPFEIRPKGTVLHVAERPWGPQVRALFTAIPGYKLVGADSSGNQFRALCHYLGPEAADYTKAALEGDVHQIHADILSEVVPGTKRGTAKPFFYAYIFGGGDAKAGLILTGARNATIGKKAKTIFASRIPGFAKLNSKLRKQFELTKTKYGARKAHILGIDGRPIYADSNHKLLNYLLQSCEKITCAAAVGRAMSILDAKGFDWQPCIFYHDELQFYVREDQAEEAAVIAAESFREAPKMFGVTLMDGEAKIGNNWAECH